VPQRAICQRRYLRALTFVVPVAAQPAPLALKAIFSV
jgi:hypothetical protein